MLIVHILREFGIGEARYANYRVAVGLLVGQGWEQRRPTLPKLCVSLFTFEQSVWGNQWLKTMLFVNIIYPHIRLSTRRQMR